MADTAAKARIWRAESVTHCRNITEPGHSRLLCTLLNFPSQKIIVSLYCRPHIVHALQMGCVSFGAGTQGQLGNGELIDALAPTSVMLPPEHTCMSIVCGGNHTVCLAGGWMCLEPAAVQCSAAAISAGLMNGQMTETTELTLRMCLGLTDNGCSN